MASSMVRRRACTTLLLSVVTAALASASAAGAARGGFDSRSLPFTRELAPARPPVEGTDVLVLQLLLSRALSGAHWRDGGTGGTDVPLSGAYDDATARAVGAFRGAARIGNATDDTFDAAVAVGLLACCSEDAFSWNATAGVSPGQLGYKYMIWCASSHRPKHLGAPGSA